MFRKANPLLIFTLFVYVNSINIFLWAIQLLGVVILRPFILYDYLLIAIFIGLAVPPVITWLYFLVVFSLDMLGLASATFLFNLPELFKNLKFAFLYQITIPQYLLAFLFIVTLYINFLLIRKLTLLVKQSWSYSFLFIFIGIAALIYGADYVNGGSYFNERKLIKISSTNLAGSALKEFGVTLIDLVSITSRPHPISHSMTFETFKQDSVGNQLLIVVESWGLPRNRGNWERMKDAISKNTIDLEWQIRIDSTPFKGGTTHAELRELLNVDGDYRYFLNKDSAKLIQSIFNLKKRQGYITTAAHSFSAKMFERYIWWKNIGIDTTFFLENGLGQKGFNPSQLNYSTPFPSLNDETAFSFLDVPVPPSQKKFSYLLTENSHLPYYKGNQKKNEMKLINPVPVISMEANNQLMRIQELLLFFITKTNGDRWSKVLIVGDHIPPFYKEADRHFYSNKSVPYIVLSRK